MRKSSTSKTTAAVEAEWRRPEALSSRSDWLDLMGREPIRRDYISGADGARSSGNVVTRTQFAVVATLWSWRDLSHGDLCVLTTMDPATLQGVVERLVRSRLVVIRIDAGGARPTSHPLDEKR